MTTPNFLLRAEQPEVTPSQRPLDGTQFTIGRAPDCDVIAARQFVSRLHARICFDGFYYVLNDAESANGTYINGRQMARPHRLIHGDHIGLGEPLAVLTFLDGDQTHIQPSRLAFDYRSWRFLWNGECIDMSSEQIELLLMLYERRGEVCNRVDCSKTLWGREYDAGLDAAALDQAASRLRNRLRSITPEAGRLVETVRGVGYRLRM
jgi:FHA domain/Transcriptional regulatory protein, C terminal